MHCSIVIRVSRLYETDSSRAATACCGRCALGSHRLCYAWRGTMFERESRSVKISANVPPASFAYLRKETPMMTTFSVAFALACSSVGQSEAPAKDLRADLPR